VAAAQLTCARRKPERGIEVIGVKARIGSALIATSTVLLAAACGGPSAQAKPSPGAPTTIKVAFSNATPSQLPLWVAMDTGIFKQDGLEIDAQPINSSQILQALIGGQIDIAQVGGSEALNAAASGADLVVIGVNVPVYQFAFWVPNSITQPSQVKGKTIGVPSKGGSSDIALRVGLPTIGLDPDRDITTIALGTEPNVVAALISGQIQGGMSHPPEAVKLAASGFHTLFDLAQKRLPAASNAIVVKRDWLETHKDIAQRYIDGTIRGVAREKKDKKAGLASLRKWLKLDDQEALNQTWDYYANQVHTVTPYPVREQFVDAQAVLGKKNPKVLSYDINKLLDPSFVKSAVDRNVVAK
jgi:ABC-type nitrate/sulfonate/bicarbonate transport system substrate-binding protein